MKFTIIALAGALASANAHQLRSNVRKLEGANANAYQAQLDGSANISFAKCIEVTVQPDNDENIQAAIQGGTAKPVKSFAAFYTNSYANDNEMMMVDLGTYVAGKVSASAMKTRQMCETCREFEETCNPEQNVSEYFYLFCGNHCSSHTTNNSAEMCLSFVCISSMNTVTTDKTMPTKITPTMLRARMLRARTPTMPSASSLPSPSTVTSVTLVKTTAATSRRRITVKLTMKSKCLNTLKTLLTVWRLKITSTPTATEFTSV